MIQLAISITFTLILTLIGVFYRRARKLKAQYSFVWKSSSSLKPKDILEDRPYAKYYYRRPENTLIEEKLKCRESMLIVGSPLSGKSRSVYQALKESNIKYDVIKPICCDINLETLIFPKDLTFWRPKLIFIDDLHWFVEKQNFDHLFRISRERSVKIIATCRSGIEFEKVKKKLIEKNMDIETIFSGNIIKHEKLSDNIGKEPAINNNIDWNNVKFDGTIGSILMPLREMEKRSEEFSNQLKTLLWVIKNLYICGIYEIDNVFHLNWIKTPSKRYEL